jgi:site-specific DNA-methyltransferase (adenine-specific)
VSADEFMASTLDVWTLPTESARRVGHPAPFPLALPERLIQLHTYADDLVLDPFMGSGTTLVAASRLRRRFVGYDLDPNYVELARQRVAAEGGPPAVTTPMATAAETALTLLADAGFTIEATKVRVARTVVPALVTDRAGRRYAVDVSGGFTVETAGLARADTVWRAIGRAVVLKAAGYPVLHLTSHLPERGSEGAAALKAVPAGTFAAVVGLTEPDALASLAALAG